MPRLPRVYIEGILYYVTAKGGHNQTVFGDDADYREYINLIDEYKRQYGFKLFGYTLLSTHIHMLIEVKNNIGISSIMHDINSRYTKIHNSRYGKKGHLFEARFKSILAEKQTQLLPLVRYIHLNPVRLGLAQSPQGYPYSSYAQFLNPQGHFRPSMREEIEECFAAIKGREREFEEYVLSVDNKYTREFEKRVHKKRIVGTKDFNQRMRDIIEEEKIRLRRRRVFTRRARLIIVSVVCALIFFSTLIVDYFYRQQKTIESEYEKALTRYQATLNMLMRQRDRAVAAEQDIAQYQWKIEIVQKALTELQTQREAEIREQMALEGYKWRIRLSQMGGAQVEHSQYDMVSFAEGRVSSANLAGEGFERTRYSRRELPNKAIVWETIQTNGRGDEASWRGEWNGTVMKGVLRKSFSDGKVADFSFESVGERMKI